MKIKQVYDCYDRVNGYKKVTWFGKEISRLEIGYFHVPNSDLTETIFRARITNVFGVTHHIDPTSAVVRFFDCNKLIF